MEIATRGRGTRTSRHTTPGGPWRNTIYAASEAALLAYVATAYCSAILHEVYAMRRALMALTAGVGVTLLIWMEMSVAQCIDGAHDRPDRGRRPPPTPGMDRSEVTSRT